MAVRAIIRESDLRRWARISREEQVAIKGRIAINGDVVISVDPFAQQATPQDDDGDLDARLQAFGAR